MQAAFEAILGIVWKLGEELEVEWREERYLGKLEARYEVIAGLWKKLGSRDV